MYTIQQTAFLESITPDALQHIERAGRTCYKSESAITPDSADKFVRMIIKRGHLSVLEHASATFRMVTDRGVTHEMVRHRIAAYSQESTRYCNYSKSNVGLKFVIPVKPDGTPAFGGSALGEALWMAAMQDAETTYLKMLEQGFPPQLARSVLPNSLATEIVMTANFREWRHVLSLRTAKAAHPQMQHLAGLVRDSLVAECPAVFDDFL
jgi:thymidylate synthase (FAD)